MMGKFAWSVLLVVALAALLLGFAGCNDNDVDVEESALLTATLTGAQEVPPVDTAASGTGTVAINGFRTAFTARLLTSGFTTPVTAAHIHLGAPGEEGPVIFTLFTANGAFPDDLLVNLTAANLEPQPDLGINTFADALQAIEQGNTYFNVHTEAYPDGEIRGQITLVDVDD